MGFRWDIRMHLAFTFVVSILLFCILVLFWILCGFYLESICILCILVGRLGRLRRPHRSFVAYGPGVPFFGGAAGSVVMRGSGGGRPYKSRGVRLANAVGHFLLPAQPGARALVQAVLLD